MSVRRRGKPEARRVASEATPTSPIEIVRQRLQKLSSLLQAEMFETADEATRKQRVAHSIFDPQIDAARAELAQFKGAQS